MSLKCVDLKIVELQRKYAVKTCLGVEISSEDLEDILKIWSS